MSDRKNKDIVVHGKMLPAPEDDPTGTGENELISPQPPRPPDGRLSHYGGVLIVFVAGILIATLAFGIYFVFLSPDDGQGVVLVVTSTPIDKAPVLIVTSTPLPITDAPPTEVLPTIVVEIVITATPILPSATPVVIEPTLPPATPTYTLTPSLTPTATPVISPLHCYAVTQQPQILYVSDDDDSGAKEYLNSNQMVILTGRNDDRDWFSAYIFKNDAQVEGWVPRSAVRVDNPACLNNLN